MEIRKTPVIPIKIFDDGFNQYGSEPPSLLRLLLNEVKQTRNGGRIDLPRWFRTYGKKDIINTIKLIQQAIDDVDIHLRKNILIVKWNGTK